MWHGILPCLAWKIKGKLPCNCFIFIIFVPHDIEQAEKHRKGTRGNTQCDRKVRYEIKS